MAEPQKEPKMPEIIKLLKSETVDAFDRTKEKPGVQIDVWKFRGKVQTLAEAVVVAVYALYRRGKTKFSIDDVLGITRFFVWLNNCCNRQTISTYLNNMARKGFLEKKGNGVFLMKINWSELEKKEPRELAKILIYDYKGSSGGPRRKRVERKEEPKTRKVSEITPYDVLLALKGKKTLEGEVGLAVELLRNPEKTLKKLPGFKELIEDGVLRVKVSFSINL